MSCPSHYSINVSNRAGHLFATAEHSIRSEVELKAVYDEIDNRFPEAEGFRVTVTHWDCVGRSVEGYPHYGSGKGER